MHRGFKGAFEEIWPPLEKIIQAQAADGKRMLVTGHSLGGALAQLATSRFPFDMAYVFGCPRVGNADFISTLQCEGVRFENTPDPVTMVPLRWGPVQALWALSHFRMPTMYVHPWRAYPLPRAGHSMENYIAALKESRGASLGIT